jgi:hypothetical protein
MRTIFIALIAVAALALSGTAVAGGWATVGLSGLPTGVDEDEEWNVVLTVLQHGQTPLAGVQPTLTIRNVDTGQKKTFAAKPTDRVGKYAVTVVFPSAGTWAYEVYDGFGQYGGAQTHTFKPVTIGGGPAGDGGTPLAWTIGGSSVLLFALLLLVAAPRLRRRWSAATAPATGLH